MKLTFGQWILLRRKYLGLTQNVIAQELNISRQIVSQWETGEIRPLLSVNQMKKLCKLFQVTIEQMLDDADQYDPGENQEKTETT
jgi:transcriptional regulator with XRE-family HTH domain